MNSRELLSQTNDNLICEAVGCNAKATSKVLARLGSEGKTIFLFLCENCKPRFSSTVPEQQDSEIGGNSIDCQQQNAR